MQRWGSGTMPQVTIRTIRRRLATAYPDLEFTYSTGGRGRMRGHSVSWIGGPLATDVQAASDCCWHNPVKHFVRQPTDAERDAMHARWDAEREAHQAAKPARRAAARAAGLVKRQTTVATRRAHAASLASAFPGVAFVVTNGKYGSRRVTWRDGPEVSVVCELLSMSQWSCDRTVSAEHAASVAAANRLARRLAASRNRSVSVARAIERRFVVHTAALVRQSRHDAQLSLF